MKFNDYFEFPREFDMEPYTVEGLAKLDGKYLFQEIMEQNHEKMKLIRKLNYNSENDEKGSFWWG